MIELTDVTKSFDKKPALGPLSLTLGGGELVGVVGAGGAGKSTLLRLMAGVLLPDAGRVLADGEDPGRSVRSRQGTLLCPEEPCFYPASSGKEAASLYAKLYPGFDRQTFFRLCELFGLDPAAKTARLSGGGKKLLMTVLGIAARPRHLLLDGLFGWLDSVAERSLKNALGRLAAEYGTTVVVSARSSRELEGFCTKILLLYRGEPVLFSDVRELKEQYEGDTPEDILLRKLEEKGYASKNIDFI